MKTVVRYQGRVHQSGVWLPVCPHPTVLGLRETPSHLGHVVGTAPQGSWVCHGVLCSTWGFLIQGSKVASEVTSQRCLKTQTGDSKLTGTSEPHPLQVIPRTPVAISSESGSFIFLFVFLVASLSVYL